MGLVTAHDPIFREDLFAQTAGWTPFYSDSRLKQRVRIEAGEAMYTESQLVIGAPVDAVVAKLRGEWTWWRQGRYRNRVEHADGTIEYEHFPLRYIVHVNSTMYPPLKLEGGAWRIHVEISDYMTGTLYFDVIPRTGGSSEIYSRFSGCRVTGPFRVLPYNGHIAARIHLLAERGDFFWPRGTGFVGLIEDFEGPGNQRSAGTI